MKTEILTPKDGGVIIGAKLIQAGEVVAFPTETVYGLGADALNDAAVRKIFEAKGRPMDNPLIIHIYDKKQINHLVSEISDVAKVLIDKFMPGPITIIMKKSKEVPYSVTAGLDTVGIRMPSHAVAAEFLKECDLPIAAPSANTSTRISPTKAEHVYEDMNGKIPLIIDGGNSEVGIESTIIDTTCDVPTILRPGAITQQMLANVLGSVKTFQGKVVVAKAPGMKYKHYAPKCDMFISEDIDKLIKAYDEFTKIGKKPIIICQTRFEEKLNKRSFIDVGDDEDSVTRLIYAALHEGEKYYNCILCQDFGQTGKYESVMNRVNKSAGGNRL